MAEDVETGEALEMNEGEEASTEEEGKRRGRKRPPASAGVLQPVKLCKAELYKPPTNEELSRLKETENLFHSNLLRLQIEELLKEVTLKEKRKHKIDSFLHEINALLSAVPETPERNITDQSWLPKGVKVPLLQLPFSVKGSFRFLPPAAVKVVGSYLLGTCIKPEVHVDVAMVMPREIFQDKDHLNQRYHRKRALYLAWVAHCLAKETLFGSVKFAYMNGNHLKPLVLLQPQGKDAKMLTVRLFACPAEGVFRPSRLHPSKNNIRTAWFLEKDSPVAGAVEPPTPHYNNSILWDLAMESNLAFLAGAATDFQGMRDGVCLFKVWLHQRKLDKGLGCFSGFLASMLVGFLLATHKINKVMSGYQVLRNALQFLGERGLFRLGGGRRFDQTLFSSGEPTLADFHKAFQVVFVDPSGLVNLCADMTVNTYRQVQFEAKRSMEVLDDKTVDGFQLLFMTPKPLIQAFDHVFHLRHVSKLQLACKKLQLLSELMDHGGNYVAATLPFLLGLLERGLAQRVLLLAHSLPETPPWPINADPPKHKDAGCLSLGLLLSPDFASSVLERGPEADRPEAVEFRQFWGERSELRRFQDGAICEAVLWDAPNVSQKRRIPERIVRHLLQLHMGIPESCICYTGTRLEAVIQQGREVRAEFLLPSRGDLGSERSASSWLWRTPFLLAFQVFPPVPMKPDYAYHARSKDRESLLPLEEKPCPAYIAPVEVICHMEGSGQWPQDKGAIQRVKAAFQLRLAELLKQQHQLLCRAAPTYTDVYKDGYVFRLRVAYHREPQILKEVVTPEGMLKYEDNEESRQLELETQHLPYLTSCLHGLQQQHPAFGSTSRLAKRWIRAQLLSDSLSEECVDLLVATLFMAPGGPPHPFRCSTEPPPLPQRLTGRVLGLLHPDADSVEIRNHFVAARPRLPVMFIATPRDQRRSMWTQARPSAQILQRLLVLALESLRALEEQLMDPLGGQDVKMVFRPPLDPYDVLIHLNPRQIPRHLEAVDRPVKSFSRGMLRSDAAVKTSAFPVVDYDPVQLFLQELREAFGALALFFHDQHGGEVIGVLWKPSAFQPQPFKVSNMKGSMLLALSTEPQTIPNVAAILEDFEILGGGLVKSVEASTEKWSI
uniref:Nucleolar protein 6 n=1 Tax=Varanus komodoensis TaxID=61221 RepID=A0A8D2LLI4_VARKO